MNSLSLIIIIASVHQWNSARIYYQNLHIFGEPIFVHIPRPNQISKLHPRTTEMVFIGISSNRKAFKCLDPSSFKIVETCDVQFLKQIQKGTSITPVNINSSISSTDIPSITDDFIPHCSDSDEHSNRAFHYQFCSFFRAHQGWLCSLFRTNTNRITTIHISAHWQADNNPHLTYWQAVNRILRYFKETSTFWATDPLPLVLLPF